MNRKRIGYNVPIIKENTLLETQQQRIAPNNSSIPLPVITISLFKLFASFET